MATKPPTRYGEFLALFSPHHPTSVDETSPSRPRHPRHPRHPGDQGHSVGLAKFVAFQKVRHHLREDVMGQRLEPRDHEQILVHSCKWIVDIHRICGMQT